MSDELIDLRSDVTSPELRRRLCEAYFEQVYKSAFPRPDEGENPDIWLPLLAKRQAPPRPTLHLIIAPEDSRKINSVDVRVAGGIVIEFFERSRSALVTYLAVGPAHQGRGLARRLVQDAIARVTGDNGGVRPVIYAEVERPEMQRTGAEQVYARRRTAIISALGGRRVGIDYIQPQLDPEKRPVEDLMLVVLVSEGSEPDSVPADAIQAFIEEFFASLDQLGSPECLRVLGSIPRDRALLEPML